MRKRIYAAENKSGGFDLIAEVIVSMLLSVGISGILCSFTNSIAANIFVMAEAAVLSAGIAFIRKKPLVSGIFNAAVIIVMALLMMFTFRYVQSAMLNSVNAVILNINEVFEKNIALLGASECGTWAMIEFYGILSAIVSVLVGLFINKKSIIAITVLSFVMIFTGMLLAPHAGIVTLMTFVGLIGCWGLCISGGGFGLVKVCGGLAAVTAIGLIITTAVGFDGFKLIDNMHTDFSEKLHEARYGNDNLPHGDLYQASDMLNYNNNTLKLTFNTPESVYLKGFTGTEFSSNRWQEFVPEKYIGEWNGMLDYFKENKFSVQRMFAEYSKADNDETQYNTITVENNGADRSYMYLPFTASYIEGKLYEDYKDLSTKSTRLFGAKKYRFKCAELEENAELLNPSAWVNKDKSNSERQTYKDNENAYRAFAQDAYLDIDELTRAEINEVFYKNFDDNLEDVGIYTITSRIRTILSLITDYEAHPAKPTDKDFIGWFLGDYKKGNSAYYATVAVMAYRAAGIPARYAEGYYVSKEDAETLKETGVNTVQLTSKNAHSWVEIYRDGLGWVSIEVTPGCYSEDMSVDEIIDISKNIGDIGGINGRDSEHYTSSLSMYSPEKADYEDRANSIISILVMLLLLLVIAGTVMYIRYIVISYKKYDVIYGQTKKDTANRMLDYICEALNADGIKANPDNPNGFRDELLKRYDDFVPQEFDRVIELLRRSSYGGAKLREHEYRTIRIFIEKVYADVYKNKNILQKIILRYVKVI